MNCSKVRKVCKYVLANSTLYWAQRYILIKGNLQVIAVNFSKCTAIYDISYCFSKHTRTPSSHSFPEQATNLHYRKTELQS